MAAKRGKENEKASSAKARKVATAWLEEHGRRCIESVDTWMLRSLLVPRSLIEAVWGDPSWRAALENAVVRAPEGTSGLLRGVESGRGIGVVDGDGETRWSDADAVTIPHPVAIDALDDARALLFELGGQQTISQLFREVFVLGDAPPTATFVTAYGPSGTPGKCAFDSLFAAMGAAAELGYPVRAGSARCRAVDAGRVREAQLWLGDGDPSYPAALGPLSWVDATGDVLPLGDVGAVAFSEGMRMASRISSKAKPEEAR